VPESATLSSLLESLEAICRIAVRAPWPCGAKATTTWQLPPGSIGT
jgi:hypothetical protein